MSYCVYIMYSEFIDKYYVGHSKDVNQRLIEHRLKRNLGASDWALKYTEQFKNRSDAMKREYEIKRKKSRKYIIEQISQSSDL